MTLRFKHEHLKDEYYSRPTLLQEICSVFEFLSNDFGIIPVVTRVTEKISGSSGVHEAGRAVDFRDQHGGVTLYTPVQVGILLGAINRRYNRTDKFQTIIHHGFRGGPKHFHIQLAPDPGVYYNTLTEGE